MLTDHNQDSAKPLEVETIAAAEEVGDAWATLMRSLGMLSRSVESFAEKPDPGNHAVA